MAGAVWAAANDTSLKKNTVASGFNLKTGAASGKVISTVSMISLKFSQTGGDAADPYFSVPDASYTALRGRGGFGGSNG